MEAVKYFKNFNSIRAIAALMVVFSHIELHKPIYGTEKINFINLIPLGGIAVTLFFVLSGFLICYLLILEHSKNGKIQLNYFYYRRILRIWPLYFLVLLIGIILYSNEVSLKNWIYSIFFFPNISFMNGELPTSIDPIWSIGIEEQFYLFFPLLFLFKDLNKVFAYIIILILTIFIIKFLSFIWYSQEVRDYLYFGRFDCMLVGALGSFVYFKAINKNKYFEIIFKLMINKIVFWLSVFATITLLYLNLVLGENVIHLLFAIPFLIILINLGVNQSLKISLENRLLNEIGKFSFGLYLTHKLTIHIILKNVHLNNIYLENLVIYLSSIILACFIAYLLYNFYEKYFLKIKIKYSKL